MPIHPRTLQCWAAMALLCACSQAPQNSLGKIQGFEVAYSLLALSEERVDLEAPTPPTQDLLRPRASGQGAYGLQPAVILRPPTRMSYQLPAVDPKAELRFGLAIEPGGYGGVASITVEASWNGEPCFSQTLDCSGDVTKQERRWREASIPVPTGGTLEFSARYDGPRKRAPRVGLGRLHVGVPFEAERKTSAPGRPNVLLIVIDTLRADRLGCYGSGQGASPVLDGLAARGTRFAAAYSAAPWTLPGTASILTGKAPYEHGVGVSSTFYLSNSLETLAEPFQRQGVTTGAFACNPLIASGRNFHQGFEHFRTYNWPRASHVHDDVVEWLDEYGDQRFFLYLHPVDPHSPYEPSPESAERFAGPAAEGILTENLRPYLQLYYGSEGFDRKRLEDSNDYRLGLYDGELFDLDQALGRILDKLETMGVLDKTIVAVTSDHGEEFLEHGWVGHNSNVYSEQTHVPLILAGPGIPQGEVVHTRLENRYLYRTLLEAAHVQGPKATEPNLLERDAQGRLAPEAIGEPVYVVNGKSKLSDFASRELHELIDTHAVIHDDWQLVVCSPEDPDLEPIVRLYDLSEDPGCLIDLAAQHPERVERYSAMAEKAFRDAEERGPTLVPSTKKTLELLRANGYVGDD